MGSLCKVSHLALVGFRPPLGSGSCDDQERSIEMAYNFFLSVVEIRIVLEYRRSNNRRCPTAHTLRAGVRTHGPEK